MERWVGGCAAQIGCFFSLSGLEGQKMRRGLQVYTWCFDVMFKVIWHKCTFTVTVLIQRNEATTESTSNSMHNHAVHDALTIGISLLITIKSYDIFNLASYNVYLK